MTTAQTVERMVPDGVRVRRVSGGLLLSDGQWTTDVSIDNLPAGDETASHAELDERVRRAVSALRCARHGEDVGPGLRAAV
jgi:hypothetical protein